MKSSFVFLWRSVLWLLSVYGTIKGGFHPGFVIPPFPDYKYPYPFAGVILVCMITAAETVFLDFLIRPKKFGWSLSRLGITFAIFFVLAVFSVFWLGISDLPEYLYAPSEHTLVLTFLLFILLVITAIIVIVKHFIDSSSKEKS